jgi:hypothetical protein
LMKYSLIILVSSVTQHIQQWFSLNSEEYRVRWETLEQNDHPFHHKLTLPLLHVFALYDAHFLLLIIPSPIFFSCHFHHISSTRVS